MDGPDYILLCHDAPARVVRLISRLSTGGNHFFVHFDRSSSDDDFALLRESLVGHRVTYLKRRRCAWGRYGMVAATLDGLHQFAALSSSRHVVLLSGTDYPVKSAQHISNFFAARPDSSFMRSWPLPRDGWSHAGGIGRFDRWYLARRCPIPPARMVAPGHGPRRMPQKMVPYGGWQWMSLSMPAAEWLVGHVDRNPGIGRFFRTTHIPDEIMIQTLLHNSPFAGTIEDAVHYVDWSLGGLHPRQLTVDDVQPLLDSTWLYARKFGDDAVTDAVDRALQTG